MKRNPQAEVTKSALATVVAVVMIGLTWMVYRWTQPDTPNAFVKVGQAFFETFETSQIAQMEMAAVDKAGKPLSFTVRRTNGLWTIPSHYDYPAEAAERLSRTATELIGLERHRLASSEKGAQVLLGTLDPTSDEGKADPENAGKLLRFTDSNGEPVFHLIIGKQVEQKDSAADSLLGLEQPTERMYYVRVPAEKESYVAKLDLDVSTKFSDWIEPDLLELTAADMRQLKVDNSRLESRQVIANQGVEVRRVRVPGEELVLEKSDDFAEWKIPDLNVEQEVMNSEAVNLLVNTIEGVELIGVRPRYKFQGQSVTDSNFDFQFPAEVANDVAAQQAIVNDLQDDLMSRGFGLARDPEGDQIKLVSEHGELKTTTKDGLVYTLYFGSQIVGSDEAIEIGAAEPKAQPAVDEAKPDGDEAKPEGENTEPAAKNPVPADQSTARFLLVRVAHDPELMSDRPVPPTEPQRMILPDGVGEPANDSANPPQESAGEKNDQAEGSTTTDEKTESSEKADDGDKAEDGSIQSSTDEPLAVNFVSFSRQDETPPVQEQTPPVQEQTPPVQEQAPPVQEQTPPVQEQAPPTTEQTSPPVIQDPVTQDTETQDTVPVDPLAPVAPPQKKMTKEDMQKALDAEFEKQKLAFESQKAQYELDVKEFATRTEKAAEKAKRLSERFANWYYVVPSSDLDRLRLTRAEVVKPKTAEPANPMPTGLPPGLQLPEGFQLPPTRLPD